MKIPHLTLEEIEERNSKKKYSKNQLRLLQEKQGLIPHKRTHISNKTCEYTTIDEETLARTGVTIQQVQVYRTQLPILLKRLARITDLRNPKKCKHKLTVLLLYGILTFAYQMSSRREANRTMTTPQFVKNLQLLFPELESIPHHDSLKRLLATIDVEQIEQAHIELIRRMIRNKKFYRYLINNSYPIAIDGTQKFKRDEIWSEECSGRTVGKGDKAKPQYFVYILEATLSFHNGMVIPLMSEFLEYTKGDTAEKKEDCETKAFKRLAIRLKKEFKRLPITLLLDGLYPSGPVMEICRKYKWDFMIVLQDLSLPKVWEEFYGLAKLQSNHTENMKWGDREQEYKWVNEIEYYYGQNQKKKIVIHVVTCKEQWQEVEKASGEIINKTSNHAWVSCKPLTKTNLHERCNLTARYRWGIENNLLIEKHHGYEYEHCFSYNWKAMKGYHYLMHLAHLLNILTEYSEKLSGYIEKNGISNLIKFVFITLTGPWLNSDTEEQATTPCQLRLV